MSDERKFGEECIWVREEEGLDVPRWSEEYQVCGGPANGGAGKVRGMRVPSRGVPFKWRGEMVKITRIWFAKGDPHTVPSGGFYYIAA